MTDPSRSEPPLIGKGMLAVGFAAIVGLFTLANTLAIYQRASVETRNRRVTRETLLSVEMVSQLSRDVDKKRLLVDTHIFQSDQPNMAAIERQIAQVDADFAETARAFGPLTVEDGEGRVWKDLQDQVASVRNPIEQALTLSRQNRDEEAREIVTALDRQFDAIERDSSKLIAINTAEARDAAVSAEARQRKSRRFASTLTLLGVILSAVVATLILRLIRSRELGLRQSWALLEQSNRDLDAFAGRVAHDLRGPLTTISLASARLARGPDEESARAMFQRGVGRMETLIRDLLTLSRIGGEAPLAASDAEAVTRAVAQEIGARVRAEGGTLQVDVEPGRVGCGEGLLHEVLWNLVDNGLKYRRPDAPLHLTISGRQSGDRYDLRVGDRGIGMSPEEVNRAFEPFFRADRARGKEGTGLGLSIVRRVVDAVGGSVRVESIPGEGSTFVIQLPLARA
jgi:signal transduction histidine kinase